MNRQSWRVDTAADFPPEGDLIVVVDHRVTHEDAAAHRDRRKGGNDAADPAARELLLPVQSGIPAVTIIVVELAGNIRSETDGS